MRLPRCATRHAALVILAPAAGLFAYALAGGSVAQGARLGLGLVTLGAVVVPVALFAVSCLLRVLTPR